MRKRKSFPVLLTMSILIALRYYVKYTDTGIRTLTEKTNRYCKSFEESREGVEPVTVIHFASPFSYGLQYPQTGQEDIDNRIIQIVEQIRNEFDAKYLPDKKTPGFYHSSGDTVLLLSYEAYIFSVSHLSLVFFETHEINGICSPTRIHIYHFDLRQKEEQNAEDLMYKGFRETASEYAQDYFQKNDVYSEELYKNYTDILSADSGLFERFALTHSGILFFIDPNVILPDSYGLTRLLISYEDMQPKRAAQVTDKDNPSQEIDPQKPMVALTFDDGPNPVFTNAILDTLEENHVTATFFDLGQEMEKYPSVSQREYALGFEIGSHSYSHANFSKLSDTEIEKDVKDTSAIFRKILGQKPTCFRPPYGSFDERVKSLIPMPFVLWSLDTRDWESRNAEAVLKVIKDTDNLDGHIILMHGIYESTAKATAMLIPYLLDEGYQLVTVSQMMDFRGDEPSLSYFP